MPQGRDINGNPMQTMRLGASRNVAITATSTMDNIVAQTTTHVRLCATVPCRILTGPGPTALSTSPRLPAECVEYISMKPGDRLAVIRDAAATSDGVLSVTEC